MRQTFLLAASLSTVLASASPVETIADAQPPSRWMLAVLVGLGIKIYRTLGRS